MSARWFNWRWRPANIWGRYRLRYLPTMTPEGRAGQEDAALRRGGGSGPAPPGFDRHFDTMHAGCSSDWSVGSEPHFCNEEIDHDGPHRCRCGVRHTPEHVYQESGGGDCGVCGRDPDDENHI